MATHEFGGGHVESILYAENSKSISQCMAHSDESLEGVPCKVTWKPTICLADTSHFVKVMHYFNRLTHHMMDYLEMSQCQVFPGCHCAVRLLDTTPFTGESPECAVKVWAYVGGSEDGCSLCVLYSLLVQTRAEFTFIYQQHHCDHYNSSSPTQPDMEGERGGGERTGSGGI